MNTGRGALIDTPTNHLRLKSWRSVISEWTSTRGGGVGLSGLVLAGEQDHVFARLPTCPNVNLTGHQGFSTREAHDEIASTTLANLTAFEHGERSATELS